MEVPENIDVMISLHVSTMKESAIRLKTYLEKSGLNVWICIDLKGGADFRSHIVQAVKKCKVFLPLINTAWANSGECSDEFGLAKRLNLTSHESGVTKDYELRRPIFCPIAFIDLAWKEHYHVELLAANTNFIVHDSTNLIDGDVDKTFQSVALSLASFGLKMDLKAIGLSIDQEKLERHANFKEGTGPTTKELIQELTATIQQQMAYLRSLEQRITNQKVSNFVQDFDPVLLRKRYIGGCFTLHNGCEKVWSLEFIFNRVEELKSEVKLTGEMTAKCIQVKDFDNTEDSAKEELKMRNHIDNDHYAKVELAGSFLTKRGLVHVDGKNFIDNQHNLIVLCKYRLVMNLDGTELSGVFDRGVPEWTATIRLRAF